MVMSLKLDVVLISPYDISEFILPVLTIPLQLLDFVGMSNQLTVGAAMESPTKISPAPQNGMQ